MEVWLKMALCVAVMSLCRAELPTVNLTKSSSLDFFVEGSSVTLTCSYSADVNSVQWMKDNLSISSNHDISSPQSGSSVLRLGNMNASDGGRYTCVVQNAQGIVSSPFIHLQRAYITVDYFSTDFDNPYQIEVTAGIPVNISCGRIVSQPSNVELDWKQRMFTTYRGVTGGVELETGELMLLEPDVSYNGNIYRCSPRNLLVPSSEFGFVQITVNSAGVPAPLQVNVHPESRSIPLGHLNTVYCIPTGRNSLATSVTWSLTPPELQSYTTTYSLEYNMPSVEVSVTCTVGGTMNYTALFTVTEPPIFTTSLSPVSLTYGDQMVLECHSPSQDVQYAWYYNGSLLEREVNSTLIRTSVTLAQHGTYQCMARNLAGVVGSASTVQVNVIGASLVQSLPRRLVVFRGWPFTLQCNATGVPPPRTNWTSPTGARDFTSTADGQLVIDSLSDSHSGSYMCTARTFLSDDTVYSMATGTTVVQVIDPTVFTSHHRDLFEAQLSTSAVFSCSVNHSTAAVVELRWTKDNVPLSNASDNGRLLLRSLGGAGMTASLQLEIRDVRVEDDGVYQCVVRTQVGNLEAPVVISSVTRFQAIVSRVIPTIHLVIATSSNSFELQWSFNGDVAQVSRYIIYVATPSAPATAILRKEWSARAVSRTDVSSPALLPYTEYLVSVHVQYLESGLVVPSEFRSVRTGVAAPLDPPRNFTIKPGQDKTIELTWQEPARPQGPIVNYIIRYRSSGTNETFTVDIISGGTKTYVLKSLDPFKDYEVQVAAATEAGLGPFTPLEKTSLHRFVLSNSAPFLQSVGFIMLVVVVALTGLVVMFIVVLVWRRHLRTNNARKYQFRNSAVHGEEPDAHLPDNAAVQGFMKRHQRAFSSSSPTTPRAQVQNHHHLTRLETNSSFGSTDHTASTQVISVGSSAHMLPPRLQKPPPYIHPPGLDSPDIFGSDHRRSLSLSAFSDKDDYVYMQSVCSSNSPSAMKRAHDNFQFIKENSDESTEKNDLGQVSSNEGTEHGDESVSSHYSHLPIQANFHQSPSPPPLHNFAPPLHPPSHVRGYSVPNGKHSSSVLPYGRSRSDDRVKRGPSVGGPHSQNGRYVEVRPGASSAIGMAPMTVGQLVEQRLNNQSAVDGITRCDTYV